MASRKTTRRHSAKALEAARKILGTCLRLEIGQDLLLVCDETTLDVADILIQAALEVDVEATCVYVPRAMQHHLAELQRVPEVLKNAISPSAAVLNALCGDEDLLDFRMALIQQAQGADRVVGHMPGVNVEILKVADADYPDIQQRCSLLAAGLAPATEAVLTTRDGMGKEHTLHLGLGGWSRLPVESTGILQRDTWGNIPSGETFIAPTSAEGTIVINGTLGDLLFAKGEEVVLAFREGQLQLRDVTPKAGPGLAKLKALHRLCRRRGDPNWNCIAELGIGVNRAVHRFTGNPLVDEKAFGTCHIAIGRSKNFGGEVDATVHVDMVTQRPTIHLEGVEWLHEGRHLYDDRELRGSYRDLPAPSEFDDGPVARTGHLVVTDSRGRLWRVLHAGRGGESKIQVGDDPTAELALTVYRKLRGHPVTPAELAEGTKLDLGVVRGVLAILDRYQLIQREQR